MFAAIASGNPLQLSTEVPNSNGLQHTIVLSSTKPKSYSHITLFILPNVTFPENFVSTVYFKLGPTEDFQLFGYLGAEKPSAIFKVRLPNGDVSRGTTGNGVDGLGEIDMEDEDVAAAGAAADRQFNGLHNISELIIGISIEPRDQGMATIEQWKQQQQLQKNDTSSLVLSRDSNRGINTVGKLANVYPILTQELAGKIVQHAYNYLSGFLDSAGNVSIKRFDTWWEKFKSRLANDGNFLDEVTSS
ncbi:hypothetical protein ZYGR_0N02390 [Zygosaccharomyces rouxii]|uniref:ZYRO0D05786p n=2 Tax=Zygosaccharomyces rouxii TaxID=4956 RepID=C5DVD4_ZYGRC|nr:uncharacterized protein ZYRO0D05786g [Zygosaccharomyces rouxii]KAH9200666.1 hypothetical protein LQ764DRAFT_97470 [Zygosaccharomyces rouxii]GAV48834.1 hypothetical protein ZYGR_0N02390 [Zygosaccharomyces rouxii]CAR27753.1 ZYRO0D05786p [Zygosaccharomyces rouxii]